MIRVIIQKPYTYDGRRLGMGDIISVAPIEALALTYQRIATLAPLRAYRAPVVPDQPPQPQAPVRRRRVSSRSPRPTDQTE